MKALIVQDDPARAAAIRAGIEEQWPGSQVVCKSSGEPVTKDLLQGIGLVVVDCRMCDGKPPGRVAEIRDRCHAPIVAAGEAEDLVHMAHAMAEGASDYLILSPETIGMAPLELKRSVAEFNTRQEATDLRRRVVAQQAAIAERDREIRDTYKSKQDLQTCDPLTALVNRRHFASLLRQEFERMKRYRYPISCFMLDLDHFRHINSTFGFPLGDTVLVRVSEILAEHARHSDIVARYGGEEFAVVLPHTPKEGALRAAERVREAIADEPFGAAEQNLHVTVSIGVASYPDPDIESEERIVHEAEKALRRAKADGRNRTCVQGRDPRIEE